MHDAALMRMRQGVGDLRPVADDTLPRQAIRGGELAQGVPLDMLHDDEDLALMLADLMDRADVRGVQRGGSAGFLEEAGGCIVGLLGEDLQRHVPAELRIVGAVDLPHAALADQGDDLVGAEARAGG